MTRIICGVDVGAQFLDARIGRNGSWKRFKNTAEGIAELAAFCRAHTVDLVVMEATGGYERKPFALLWAAGMPVAIANPRSVRRFAEAMGVLEKTDRIDCGLIAWYAETKRLAPTQPASATQQRLTALVVRLRQLTISRVEQLNQRRLVTEPDALDTFAPVLASITTEMRKLEKTIAQAIAQDPLWAAFDRTFRTIKGVADRTVAHLMAELPEIGTLSNKAVAKLVGLAPLANDSGTISARRPVRGGRANLRSLLFVVAGVVARHEPDFIAFHQTLSKAGKPKMIVRTALARKLIVRLNAKARELRQNAAIPA